MPDKIPSPFHSKGKMSLFNRGEILKDKTPFKTPQQELAEMLDEIQVVLDKYDITEWHLVFSRKFNENKIMWNNIGTRTSENIVSILRQAKDRVCEALDYDEDEEEDEDDE